jgi:hypothetical protein
MNIWDEDDFYEDDEDTWDEYDEPMTPWWVGDGFDDDGWEEDEDRDEE